MLTLPARTTTALWSAAVLIGALAWHDLAPARAAGSGLAPKKAKPGATAAAEGNRGRIGRVTDLHGLVSIRPAGAERWSPVADCLSLRAGDWLRTDASGAHAVSLGMDNQARLILGPGTLVELIGPGRIRVSTGELQATAAANAPVAITGPDGKETVVAGVGLLYRVENKRLTPLGRKPAWLRGYESVVANKAFGSLVAKIDGRDVPLPVGCHKVAVEIRDQIARTTVEESFVNAGGRALDGVFRFPLPQDASIAGFGVWNGDRNGDKNGGELVEADVVERPRPREGVETGVHPRRDPALLEWTGGSVFKARVSSIPGRSEKRITLTYTQVLPLRGGSYRYRYALQNDMLQGHPLRQLEIDVRVRSSIPLRRVASPTHVTRNSLTDHSARVEFSARDCAPPKISRWWSTWPIGGRTW